MAQLYLNSYGWIEFEPTSSKPALDRPAGPPGTVEEEVPATTEDIMGSTAAV